MRGVLKLEKSKQVLRDYYRRCEHFKRTDLLHDSEQGDLEKAKVLLKTLYKGEPLEKVQQRFENQQSVESVFLNRQKKLY